MKASEIIRGSCCGQLLDIPVFKLVEKVKSLEDELAFTKNQLANATDEIVRLKS